MTNFSDKYKEAAEARNRIEEILRTKRPRAEPSRIEYNRPVLIKKSEKNFSKYSLFLKAFFLGIGILLLIFVVGGGGYKIFSQLDFGSNSYEKDSTLEDVGKLLELPVGEDPTIATITDLNPLKGQEFFKDAKVGDKVIIYSESAKAILYRSSEKRVIVVAPINK